LIEFQAADGRTTVPPCSPNGDKSYNCREETLRAIKQQSSSKEVLDHPTSSTLIRTFDSSPRCSASTASRVVLVTDHGSLRNGGLSGWNCGSGARGRQQLLPQPATANTPDIVVGRAGGCPSDQKLSTFGRTLPLAKRTASSIDNVDSFLSTPDVKVWYSFNIYPCTPLCLRKVYSFCFWRYLCQISSDFANFWQERTPRKFERNKIRDWKSSRPRLWINLGAALNFLACITFLLKICSFLPENCTFAPLLS